MIRRIKNSIPNTITCLNLLSGCMACICSFSISAPLAGELTGLQLAWIFIGAAAVFDFMDGASARLLHAHSLIGKELDSLSDLVSFGLAPSFLMLNTLEQYGLGYERFIALIIPVLGALRLAKFNIDDRQSTSFIGLPIPANAIFWIGYSAFLFKYFPEPAALPDVWTWITGLLIVLVPVLMVSRLRMFSLKFKNVRPDVNFLRYLIIIATILFVIFIGIEGFCCTIILYIAISGVNSLRR